MIINPWNISTFASDLQVVAYSDAAAGSRKIVQIQINTGPNRSIYVNFTYVPFTSGIARLENTKMDAGESKRIDFLEHRFSWKTTEKPKYSHHQDGECHFSMDGKIYTKVRRKASPLHLVNAQFFTTLIKGLESYPLVTAKDLKYRPEQRQLVQFTSSSGSPGMVKIVGFLYTFEQYLVFLNRNPGGRTVLTENGLLVIRRANSADEQYAVLTSRPTGELDLDRLFLLLRISPSGLDPQAPDQFNFLGGFGDPFAESGTFDGRQIAMRFPASVVQRSLQRIQSMNYRPKPKPVRKKTRA